MNKKGTGIIITIIVFLLMMFGLKGCIEEDIPSVMGELKEKICIPLRDKLSVCFTNQSGVVVNGEFKDLKINLRTQDKTIPCSVGNGVFKFQTVCKDELGYIYQKENFTLDFIVDGEYIKSIPRYQIFGLFYNVARNPKAIRKNVWKTVKGALILRGIIYLAEHPEVFNASNST